MKKAVEKALEAHGATLEELAGAGQTTAVTFLCAASVGVYVYLETGFWFTSLTVFTLTFGLLRARVGIVCSLETIDHLLDWANAGAERDLKSAMTKKRSRFWKEKR